MFAVFVSGFFVSTKMETNIETKVTNSVFSMQIPSVQAQSATNNETQQTATQGKDSKGT